MKCLLAAVGLTLLGSSAAGPCEDITVPDSFVCPYKGAAYTGGTSLTANQATVCMVLNGTTVAQFDVKVDHLAQIEVPAKYAVQLRGSQKSCIHLAINSGKVEENCPSNTCRTPLAKAYFSKGDAATFMTAYVQAIDGHATGFQWEDSFAASAKASGVCDVNLDGNCAIKPAAGDSLKVYVGWVGTDARGSTMTSGGDLMSRYTGSSLNLDAKYEAAGKAVAES